MSFTISAEDHLEHFGKKGMKWGVRNEDSSGSGSIDVPDKKGWSKKKKTLLAVAAVGAVTAAVILSKNSQTKVSTLPPSLGDLTARDNARRSEALDRSRAATQEATARSRAATAEARARSLAATQEAAARSRTATAEARARSLAATQEAVARSNAATQQALASQAAATREAVARSTQATAQAQRTFAANQQRAVPTNPGSATASLLASFGSVPSSSVRPPFTGGDALNLG